MKRIFVTVGIFLIALSAVASADDSNLTQEQLAIKNSWRLPKDPERQDRREDHESDRKIKAERQALKSNMDNPPKDSVTK